MSQNTVQHERHAGHGQDLVDVECSFGLTTDGAVTAVKGRGITVAKVAATTGQYTVTLDRKYPECVTEHVTLSNATATDYSVQSGGYSSTTGALTIFVMDSDDVSGVPAVADLSGPRINVSMKLTKYLAQVTP